MEKFTFLYRYRLKKKKEKQNKTISKTFAEGLTEDPGFLLICGYVRYNIEKYIATVIIELIYDHYLIFEFDENYREGCKYYHEDQTIYAKDMCSYIISNTKWKNNKDHILQIQILSRFCSLGIGISSKLYKFSHKCSQNDFYFNNNVSTIGQNAYIYILTSNTESYYETKSTKKTSKRCNINSMYLIVTIKIYAKDSKITFIINDNIINDYFTFGNEGFYPTIAFLSSHQRLRVLKCE